MNEPPFEINGCDMPTQAEPREAALYRRVRDTLIAPHCADGRRDNCAGKITITARDITLQCPRCGDARHLIEQLNDQQRGKDAS